MSDEFNEDEGQESPKDLRARLEEATKQNRQFSEELGSYKAKDFLAEKEFDLVEAGDLKGTPPTEWEAKAKEVQGQRSALQEKLLRAALKKQGIDEDDLDDIVAQLAGRQADDDGTADAARRIRQVGQAEGKPVPAVNPETLHGFDALTAHFEEKERKSKRR